MKNDIILIVSDLHLPYQHVDNFKFLQAIKKKYKPTRIIFTGDEIDHHAMSFHDSDPDLSSAGDELRTAIDYLQPLYELFPVVDLMESNHGSMLYRRAKAHGIPRQMLKDYREFLEAPIGWKWHHELVLNIGKGRKCYFSHGMSGRATKVAQMMGCCAVQGHRHSEFFIEYMKTAMGMNFAMSVGAMLDINEAAAAYGKYGLKKSIYGHGIIIKGEPRLLPMNLNSRDRWDKSLV
tara:strand:- start:689 stop:1393 length:705 start_codon:yes stop_codon:yes gene_type:complete